MAGLMNTMENTPPRTEAMASDAPVPADASMGEGEEQATPDEQRMYDTLVNKAYEVIYQGGKTNPQILKSLEGGGEPVDGLANTTAMVMMRLEDAGERQGKKFPPDVMLHAGVEVLEDLADLAGQAKIHKFNEEEIQGATYQALDIYRATRQKQGKLDMPAIQQDFQQIMEANKAGQLGELLPGVEEGAAPAEEPSRGLMQDG
jgi:hypothetical protein